jgi:hypothetical protein
VKRVDVYLDDELNRAVRKRAKEQGRSYSGLVREAVGQYLAGQLPAPEFRRGMPHDEWRATMEAVLERIWAGVPKDIPQEEIEADITAAREEVRQERMRQRMLRTAKGA